MDHRVVVSDAQTRIHTHVVYKQTYQFAEKYAARLDASSRVFHGDLQEFRRQIRRANDRAETVLVLRLRQRTEAIAQRGGDLLKTKEQLRTPKRRFTIAE